jgi:glycosyltransferase involved in cell wall biosynthesis
LVSVVIPSYNHRRFVGEAVESLLDSSIKEWEAVIVDDGSRDGSTDFIKRIKDPRIRLYPQANQGAHAAINRGVSLAEAPWIAVLNSDDRFHVSKLERHLEFHERHPECEASASLVRYISESGAPFPEDSYLVRNYRKMRTGREEHDSPFASLLLCNHLITSSNLFIRKRVFNEIGGFIPLRYNHDWFMFLALALRGRLMVLDEPLVDYRRHSGNTVTEDEESGRVEANFVLEWHLFRNFVSGNPLVDPRQASAIVDGNPGSCRRLLFLFQGWRQYKGNDLAGTMSLFTTPNHPIRLLALRILREERPLLNIRRLAKRVLGSDRAMRVADCGLRAYGAVRAVGRGTLKPRSAG